jgi:hypothetical protein
MAHLKMAADDTMGLEELERTMMGHARVSVAIAQEIRRLQEEQQKAEAAFLSLKATQETMIEPLSAEEVDSLNTFIYTMTGHFGGVDVVRLELHNGESSLAGGGAFQATVRSVWSPGGTTTHLGVIITKNRDVARRLRAAFQERDPSTSAAEQLVKNAYACVWNKRGACVVDCVGPEEEPAEVEEETAGGDED